MTDERVKNLNCPVCGSGEEECCVCEQMLRAEAAEAKVARVEPLLHDGEGHLPSGLTVDLLGIAVDMEQEGRPLFAKWLRLLSEAALADAPAERPAMLGGSDRPHGLAATYPTDDAPAEQRAEGGA
jgi:hypothetical protein